MGVGAGLYMYDVVVKSSRSLSHLLMSSCWYVASASQKSSARWTPPPWRSEFGRIILLGQLCNKYNTEVMAIFQTRKNAQQNKPLSQ